MAESETEAEDEGEWTSPYRLNRQKKTTREFEWQEQT